LPSCINSFVLKEKNKILHFLRNFELEKIKNCFQAQTLKIAAEFKMVAIFFFISKILKMIIQVKNYADKKLL
jgi:hypothetical protein